MYSKLFTVEFVFVPELKIELKLKVDLHISKLRHEFNNSKIIKYTNSIITNDFYVETFSVFSEKTLICTFNLDIYSGITNYIIYDIMEKNSITFEMLFYGKKGLPKDISYKSYKLNKFDTNFNKYRQRMCIVNVNPDKLEYINNNNVLKNYKFIEGSYKIIIRISNSNKLKFSLTKINESTNPENKKIVITEKDIKLLEEFNNKYQNFLQLINDSYKKMTTEEKENNLISELDIINTYYFNIKENKIYGFLFNMFNYENIPDIFELIHLLTE